MVARVHCGEAKQRLECNFSKSDRLHFVSAMVQRSWGQHARPAGRIQKKSGIAKHENELVVRGESRAGGALSPVAVPRSLGIKMRTAGTAPGPGRDIPCWATRAWEVVFCELQERYISLYKPAVERALVYSEKKKKAEGAERAERVGGD